MRHGGEDQPRLVRSRLDLEARGQVRAEHAALQRFHLAANVRLAVEQVPPEHALHRGGMLVRRNHVRLRFTCQMCIAVAELTKSARQQAYNSSMFLKSPCTAPDM